MTMVETPFVGDLDWHDEGLCRETDPEAFFPEIGQEGWSAKNVCAICSVRDKCLKSALDNDEEWGVWGGLTYRERRRFSKAGLAPTKSNIDSWLDRTRKNRERRIRENNRKYLD